jgi:hypothetical protein
LTFDARAFAKRGAVLFPAVLDADTVLALADTLEVALGKGRPGRRLTSGSWGDLLTEGPLGLIAATIAGEGAHPVRVVLFDKTAGTNWGVAWHQDRTIAVRERKDIDGFGPWSVKDGIVHVEPPIEILDDMVTLRLHLDDCGEENGPLRVVPGTHSLGAIPAHRAADLAEAMPTIVCTAKAGDVWACATLILHASSPALYPGRRRVLQIDYAVAVLPDGLEWRGIDEVASPI